jgi:hypothetical protein
MNVSLLTFNLFYLLCLLRIRVDFPRCGGAKSNSLPAHFSNSTAAIIIFGADILVTTEKSGATIYTGFV